MLTATLVMAHTSIPLGPINFRSLSSTNAACQSPPYSEAQDQHMPVHTLTRTPNHRQVAISRCNSLSTLRRSPLNLRIPLSIEEQAQVPCVILTIISRQIPLGRAT